MGDGIHQIPLIEGASTAMMMMTQGGLGGWATSAELEAGKKLACQGCQEGSATSLRRRMRDRVKKKKKRAPVCASPPQIQQILRAKRSAVHRGLMKSGNTGAVFASFLPSAMGVFRFVSFRPAVGERAVGPPQVGTWMHTSQLRIHHVHRISTRTVSKLGLRWAGR